MVVVILAVVIGVSFMVVVVLAVVIRLCVVVFLLLKTIAPIIHNPIITKAITAPQFMFCKKHPSFAATVFSAFRLAIG